MKKLSFYLMLFLSSLFVSCSDSEEPISDGPIVISTLDLQFTLQDAQDQDLVKRLTVFPNKYTETNQIYDTWKNQYNLTSEDKRVGGGAFKVSKATDPHCLMLTLIFGFDSRPVLDQINGMEFTMVYSQLLGDNKPVRIKTYWKFEAHDYVCTKMEWDGQEFQAVNGVIPVKLTRP